jgi:hypothetical protein
MWLKMRWIGASPRTSLNVKLGKAGDAFWREFLVKLDQFGEWHFSLR